MMVMKVIVTAVKMSMRVMTVRKREIKMSLSMTTKWSLRPG